MKILCATFFCLFTESEFLRKFRNLHFKQVPRVMLTTKVSEETDAVFSKYNSHS